MIKSVVRMGDVLAVLGGTRRDLGLSEVAERAGMSAGQTHKYLASMIEIGIAEQDFQTTKYRLGPMALKIGLSALGRQDILSTSQTAVRALCSNFGVTGHVSVWGPSGPVIVGLHRGGSSFVTTLGLGVVAPLVSSATGLVFVAYSSPALVRQILEEELLATPMPASRLEDIVSETRKARSAFVSGTMIPGLCARSAPVLDMQNEIVCSATLISPSPDTLSAKSKASRALHDLCFQLSSQFGATI